MSRPAPVEDRRARADFGRDVAEFVAETLTDCLFGQRQQLTVLVASSSASNAHTVPGHRDHAIVQAIAGDGL